MKRQHLTLWLLEELRLKYSVPYSVGQVWIDNNELLLLLDGLDEVAEAQRLACIEAINIYRQEHYLVPVVVCSRKVEYLALATQIMLYSTVVIQPLSTRQIDEYFSCIGESLETVYVALQDDRGLREMVKTPLMLSIVTLAYQGKILDNLVAMTSPEMRQQQIFETYIQRLLHRRGLQTSYTSQQTKYWLAWLARQLIRHNQTVFYLERMQADTLSGYPAYRIYECLVISFPNVLIGAIVSLLIITILFSAIPSLEFVLCYGTMGGLIGGLIGKGKRINLLVESNVSMQRTLWYNITSLRYLRNGLVIGLVYGLTYGHFHGLGIGLIYGLIFGLVSNLFSIIFDPNNLTWLSKEATTQPWKNHWYKSITFWYGKRQKGAILPDSVDLVQAHNCQMNLTLAYLKIGLIIGLSCGLGYGLSTELIHQFHFSQIGVLANFLAYYVIAYVLIGILISVILEKRNYILQPAELIIWSWRSSLRNLIDIKHLRNALFVGMLVGPIMGLSMGLREEKLDKLTIGLLFGLNAGFIFGVSYWLLIGLFKTLSSNIVNEDQLIKPNQGTWDSARNSVIVGLIGGCASWFVCSLSYTLSYMFINNLNLSAALMIGQQVATGIGLLMGVSTGLLCGLLNGGLAYLHHWILRLLLWHSGSIPWSYAEFLDYAAERILPP